MWDVDFRPLVNCLLLGGISLGLMLGALIGVVVYLLR
jgi:hypothetical protein